jgi:hypothetical protein
MIENIPLEQQPNSITNDDVLINALLAQNPMLNAGVGVGAEFSKCRNYRYSLWRIWDDRKPYVMFIGLNPSTANEATNDPTIKSVCRIAKSNGYGGVYMMNCFPFVSTDPNKLRDFGNTALNDHWLYKVSSVCNDIVFAWGSFDVVKELGRDKELEWMFPNAKALHINKNGSPKHPLYCKSDIKFVNWQTGNTCI